LIANFLLTSVPGVVVGVNGGCCCWIGWGGGCSFRVGVVIVVVAAVIIVGGVIGVGVCGAGVVLSVMNLKT
jgi:hypothetical protein